MLHHRNAANLTLNNVQSTNNKNVSFKSYHPLILNNFIIFEKKTLYQHCLGSCKLKNILKDLKIITPYKAFFVYIAGYKSTHITLNELNLR